MSSQTIPTAQSRRTLLVGAMGAVGATVLGALGRAAPVHAESETMKVGGEYSDATSRTYLKNSANDADVFVATTTGSGKGVWGKSSDGPGVYAESTHSTGLQVSGDVAIEASAHSDSGFALQAKIGRVRFDSISGEVTIPAGLPGVTLNLLTHVANSAFVLLSPRGNLGGRWVWYTTDSNLDVIYIRISSTRTVDTRVGYLLVG